MRPLSSAETAIVVLFVSVYIAALAYMAGLIWPARETSPSISSVDISTR